MNKTLPMFEEMAYKKEQDFLNRQLQFSNVLMQWDSLQADRNTDFLELIKLKSNFIIKLSSRELENFKVMAEQRQNELSFELEKKKFDLAKKAQELDNEWKRVNNLGYVDNQASIKLGVKVGTKAEWVQKSILEQKNRLALMDKQHQYDLDMAKVNAAIEKELFAEEMKVKNKYELLMMKEQYGYDVKLISEKAKIDAQIMKVKERIAAEEEAARQAEAEARAKEKEASAAEAADIEAEDEKLKAEYKYTKNRLKDKFDTNSNGLIDKGQKQKAAKFMLDLAREGVDQATINRLKAEYGIPDYVEETKKETKKSSFKDIVSGTYQNWNQIWGG
jgi:hypothetical protein